MGSRQLSAGVSHYFCLPCVDISVFRLRCSCLEAHGVCIKSSDSCFSFFGISTGVFFFFLWGRACVAQACLELVCVCLCARAARACMSACVCGTCVCVCTRSCVYECVYVHMHSHNARGWCQVTLNCFLSYFLRYSVSLNLDLVRFC